MNADLTPTDRIRAVPITLQLPAVPAPATVSEERVDGWLRSWIAGRMSEDGLEALLCRDVWRPRDLTPALHRALRDGLHHTLVQYRDAVQDWHDVEPAACGPSSLTDLAECGDNDTCGLHRQHLYSYFGLRDLYLGQVIEGVKLRAVAMVRKVERR